MKHSPRCLYSNRVSNFVAENGRLTALARRNRRESNWKMAKKEAEGKT